MSDAPRRESVFLRYDEHPEYRKGGYPYKFAATLEVPTIAGGTPSNPNVAEAWIKSKGYKDIKDDLIASEVATVIEDRGLEPTDAIEEVAKRRMLNGFRRDEHGLYLEGRCLKACLKEAASVAADVEKLPARGFGLNKKKGGKSFFAEHVFVREERLYLGVTEPTEIQQSFVSTYRGNGISYKEIVQDAVIHCTIETDHVFPADQWASIWLTAQNQGLGANRSQGYGVFIVTQWDEIAAPKALKKASRPKQLEAAA